MISPSFAENFCRRFHESSLKSSVSAFSGGLTSFQNSNISTSRKIQLSQCPPCDSFRPQTLWCPDDIGQHILSSTRQHFEKTIKKPSKWCAAVFFLEYSLFEPDQTNIRKIFAKLSNQNNSGNINELIKHGLNFEYVNFSIEFQTIKIICWNLENLDFWCLNWQKVKITKLVLPPLNTVVYSEFEGTVPYLPKIHQDS